jgi:hypothetical protein
LLRGEEWFEDRADLFRIETAADILDQQLHTGLTGTRGDRDLAIADRVVAHRLAGIEDQVQHQVVEVARRSPDTHGSGAASRGTHGDRAA